MHRRAGVSADGRCTTYVSRDALHSCSQASTRSIEIDYVPALLHSARTRQACPRRHLPMDWYSSPTAASTSLAPYFTFAAIASPTSLAVGRAARPLPPDAASIPPKPAGRAGLNQLL
eukprot:3799717-Prymnesium_polylepis.1